MNGMLRSKQGCWTCRLRRKKCDERRDVCQTCEGLSITCYGYGPKPEWMDNGEREREMAMGIKSIVKQTSRRKGRLGGSVARFQARYRGKSGKDEEPIIRIAPKSTNAPNVTIPTARSPISERGTSADPKNAVPESDSSVQSSGQSTGASPITSIGTSPSCTSGVDDHLSTSWSTPQISSDESALLMHFLDNVFPLQYPMYKPPVVEKGRGWLLSLLLRTKPLYHAALGLSSYHAGVTLLEAHHNSVCRTFNVIEQEKHIAICLSEFQQAIKNVGQWIEKTACQAGNSLGLMACIVQLVFFELFAGHGFTWQIHLRAGTDIFCQGYYDQLMGFGMADTPDGPYNIWVNFPFSEEVITFRFLSAVMVWLDLVSCITTGNAPRLQAFHTHVTTAGPQIDLESIVGCKNWAALEMGRVSALHEFKVQHIRNNCLDGVEFSNKADQIKRDLQRQLTEGSLEHLGISQATPCIPIATPQAIVTRIFGLTSLIYLHLIVHGFQNYDRDFEATREEILTILRGQMQFDLLPAVISPLFIMGCAARKEDEPLFRHVFSSAPVVDPSLEHRAKILPLLEETWRKRDATGGNMTWQDSLDLSEHPLLLL